MGTLKDFEVEVSIRYKSRLKCKFVLCTRSQSGRKVSIRYKARLKCKYKANDRKLNAILFQSAINRVLNVNPCN